MKTIVKNYQVAIKKDVRTGTNKPVYSSFVPELGISSDGDTVEETLRNTKDLITFHLESLVEEGVPIPNGYNELFFVDTQIKFNTDKPVRYA